jgi:hypothetical protein
VKEGELSGKSRVYAEIQNEFEAPSRKPVESLLCKGTWNTNSPNKDAAFVIGRGLFHVTAQKRRGVERGTQNVQSSRGKSCRYGCRPSFLAMPFNTHFRPG